MRTRIAAFAAAATLVALPLVAPNLSADAAATRAARPFDFNGDGRTDLAIGVPDESLSGPGTTHTGAVQVLYGARHGVTSKGQKLWTEDTAGVPGFTEDADRFGESLASGDFNGDGYADLAIDIPGENSGNGAIDVLYGTKSGLRAQVRQRINRGVLQTGGRRANRVVAGDLDGDGYADLVIGSGLANYEGSQVSVVFGGHDGLDLNRKQHVVTSSGTGATQALAVGDVDGDGADELAIGFDGAAEHRVDVVSGWGTATLRTTSLVQGDTGIDAPGVTWAGFGHTVGFGDLDGDGHDDLIVGDPAATAAGVAGAGAVLVVPGSATGLQLAGRRPVYQGAAGLVPGVSETGDRFGARLASGDLNGDGRADLAVGVPGETPGHGPTHSGDVAVLYGSASGLSSRGAQRWSEATKGVPGKATTEDHMGDTVMIGQFGHGHWGDLAVGVPHKRIGSVPAAGAVNVLYGGARGVTVTEAQLWSQATPGVSGTAENGDHFGQLGTNS